MTKTPIPLRADDLTIFTRALSRELGEESPSHLTLMNMVSRAVGFQNVQHMRSTAAAQKRLARPKDDAAVDPRSVERTLHQFDEYGRLRQWPAKRTVQTLSLWALWATLPVKQTLDERSLNALLTLEHLFKDAATLRRSMVSCGLLTRKRDGTAYRRLEQEPSPEAKAIIHAISARRRTRVGYLAGKNHA